MTPVLVCVACRHREVLFPVLICWFCRQKGIKGPRIAPSRRAGKARWRYLWTAKEDERLRLVYPTARTADILHLFPGRNLRALWRRAQLLGISKTPESLAAINKESSMRCRGRSSRFKAGLIPWNKGCKGWHAGGRSRDTQFRPGTLQGQALKRLAAVGTVVADSEGYLRIKVAQTADRRQNWRLLHILIWEEGNGPVPNGHAVTFRDGDRKNVAVTNLVLMSRRALMSRNSVVARYPPELVGLIRQLGGLKRRIKQKEKDLCPET